MSRREVLPEGEDLFHLCSAKAIDRLVVIANHTEILLLTDQRSGQSELGRIGILVLIDQQVIISTTPPFSGLFILLE